MESHTYYMRLITSLRVTLSFLLIYKVMRAGGAPAIEQSHYDIICNNILRLDCAVFAQDSPNCGTDGVTYKNSCAFAQAHCRSPSLHVQHTGVCDKDSGGGSPQEEGLTVVLQLVCDDIVHVDCTGQPRVVLCASDGYSYINNCFYEKARCKSYNLYVLHAGYC